MNGTFAFLDGLGDWILSREKRIKNVFIRIKFSLVCNSRPEAILFPSTKRQNVHLSHDYITVGYIWKLPVY